MHEFLLLLICKFFENDKSQIIQNFKDVYKSSYVEDDESFTEAQYNLVTYLVLNNSEKLSSIQSSLIDSIKKNISNLESMEKFNSNGYIESRYELTKEKMEFLEISQNQGLLSIKQFMNLNGHLQKILTK
jgi:hypothetical protein